MRTPLLLSLLSLMLGCTSADPEDPGDGVGGESKTDGDVPLLVCRQTRLPDDDVAPPVKIDLVGPLKVIDHGFHGAALQRNGLPVKEYRIIGKVRVGRDPVQAIDKIFLGNLYQADYSSALAEDGWA